MSVAGDAPLFKSRSEADLLAIKHPKASSRSQGSHRSGRSRLSMTGSFVSGRGSGVGSLGPNSIRESLARTASASGSQWAAQEAAYKEAMDRHINEMEIAAGDAIKEKKQWEMYIKQCIEEEKLDIERRRYLCRDNQSFVQSQMNHNERRRQEGRKTFIENASAHEFPVFTEPPANVLAEKMKNQQNKMRTDLDHQVRTNNTLRNVAKQRERELEANQLEANRQEMAMLRELQRMKRDNEKDSLQNSWNREIRMKNIWKAIQNHQSAAGQQSQIEDFMGGGEGSQRGASAAPSLAGSGSQAGSTRRGF